MSFSLCMKLNCLSSGVVLAAQVCSGGKTSSFLFQPVETKIDLINRKCITICDDTINIDKNILESYVKSKQQSIFKYDINIINEWIDNII